MCCLFASLSVLSFAQQYQIQATGDAARAREAEELARPLDLRGSVEGAMCCDGDHKPLYFMSASAGGCQRGTPVDGTLYFDYDHDGPRATRRLKETFVPRPAEDPWAMATCPFPLPDR